MISERAAGNDNARFRIAPFTATARRGNETHTRMLHDGIELHSLPRLSIRFSLVKRAILSRGPRETAGRCQAIVNHGNRPRA